MLPSPGRAYRLIREQLSQVGGDDLLQEHEYATGLRDWHEAREHQRHLDDREAALGLAGRAVEPQREVEAERREQRKRPGHINGQRRQHGKHGLPKERAEGDLLRGPELGP